MKFYNIKKLISKQKNAVYIFILGIVFIGISLGIGLIIFGNNPVSDFFFTPEVYNSPGILISDNANFIDAHPRFNVDSSVDKTGITYTSIKIDEVLESEGQYIDPEQAYLAYTFYILNTGTQTITVDYYMRITEVYNSMNEYVRILIIEDDDAYRMYQKADQPDEENNIPQYNQMPLGIDFESETIVFRDSFSEFRPNEVKRFIVIIWLEEQDTDINDDFQSGRIRTQLNFIIRTDYETSSSQTLLLSNEVQNLWIPLVTICNVDFKIQYGEEDIS